MAKSSNKDRRLRILWSSNSHWSQSGYGVFTRDLLFRLRDDGWPLAEVGFFGLQGNPATVDGIKVYPGMNDPYGSDALFHSAINFKANVAFAMQDIPLLQPQFLQLLCQNKIPWIPYLPIDQSPPPPSLLERLKFAHKIITFSKFGQEELEKHGFASTLIYEGTDPETFKPMDKLKCRKEIGLPPDKFVFLMVAANKENPPRKGFQEVLEAFKMFWEKHPESVIVFHTQQVTPGGFPIQEYAKHLGILSQVMFVDQYKATHFSDSGEIAKEMNACDVYLQPSMTEGFGLTSIEAQSCGKPVIVNNCQSMPELVVPEVTGEICNTGKGWWRNMGGFVFFADVESLHSRMERLYRRLKERPERVSQDCRKHILTNFDINVIFKDKWAPMFEELQTELLGNPK